MQSQSLPSFFHLHFPKAKFRKKIQKNSFIIFTCPNPVLLVPSFSTSGLVRRLQSNIYTIYFFCLFVIRIQCLKVWWYKSCLSQLIVILVHTTGLTRYKVLYHHTMYVMGIYWSLKKLTREYWYSDSNLRPFFSYKKATKNHI